jgi:hypothetical protein
VIAGRLLQAAALAVALLDTAEGFRVEAPSGPVLLGRRFELVVRGPLEPGDRLAADAPGAGLSAGEPGLLEGAQGRELRWPLRALGEGEFTLTGLAVERDGERHALPDVPVSVVLDLPPGELPEVAAPLPPVRVPYAPADLRPFLLGVPLALLLLALVVARASRPVRPPRPAPRPPELVAAQALANLRGRLPRTRDEVPPFVVEVSGVLRSYIEERFAVRAPECTTEEFLPLAAAHPALADQRGMLGGFLHQCDLVKFAGLRPDPAGMPEVLAAAERFVDTTGGLPATPAEAAA